METSQIPPGEGRPKRRTRRRLGLSMIVAGLMTLLPVGVVSFPTPVFAGCPFKSGPTPVEQIDPNGCLQYAQDQIAGVIRSVVAQLPPACAGLNQPIAVSQKTLDYCLAALQNLTLLTVLTG